MSMLFPGKKLFADAHANIRAAQARSGRLVSSRKRYRGASLEVREVPSGRGGGSGQAILRHPESHPATPQGGRWLGTLRMTRRAAQTGPRFDSPRGHSMPSKKNVAFRGLWSTSCPRKNNPTTPDARKESRKGKCDREQGTVQWPNEARRCSRPRLSGKSLAAHKAACPAGGSPAAGVDCLPA